MQYIAVVWRHEFDTAPRLLVAELDDERWEVCKVDVNADGRANYADSSCHTGDTELGLGAVPRLTEIAEYLEFEPREISQHEFEAIWQAALQSGRFSDTQRYEAGIE